MGRNQVSYRQARRRVQQKYGLQQPPTFAQKHKGRAIFERADAQAVQRKRTKTHWKIENVEWIRQGKKIAQGGGGTVFLGKIKLKGEPKPRTIIIKRIFNQELSEHDKQRYQTVIERLNQSEARHPKMFFLESNRKWYLISEPFLQTKKRKKQSKFDKEGIDFFDSIKLQNRQQRALFLDCMRQAAHLANAALGIRYDDNRKIDVFNRIRLANGQESVFVQDPDLLMPFNYRKFAWKESVHYIRWNLRRRLTPTKLELADHIIQQVEREFDLA